jgi:hypothetical protein
VANAVLEYAVQPHGARERGAHHEPGTHHCAQVECVTNDLTGTGNPHETGTHCHRVHWRSGRGRPGRRLDHDERCRRHDAALAVFWGSGTVAQHPSERRYAQVTLVFTGKRPPFYQLVNGKRVTTYPPTQTWPLQP